MRITKHPNIAWDWLDRHQLLLLAMATPLLLFPGWWTPLGSAVIALTWVARRQARGTWSFPTYLDKPVLVLLFMMGIGLLVSTDLSLSLNRASVILLGVAIFYGLVNGLHTERQVLNAGISLMLVGMGAALISWVGTDWQPGIIIDISLLSRFYGWLPVLVRGIPGSGVPRSSDLINPRAIAGATTFLLPVPLSFLFWGRGRKLKLVSGFAIFIMAITLLLTQSPQAVVGTGVALLLLGIYWDRRFLGILPLGIGALLWAWKANILELLPPALVHRLWLGLSARLEIWQRALYMIRDMPFTGIGLNTFPIIDDGFYNLVPNRISDAHNIYLQAAVDLGIPGLIAFLALVLGFARTVVRAYSVTSDPNIRALLVGSAAGVAGWLGYGMIDTIFIGNKVAMALWAMLGLVAAVNRMNGGMVTRPSQKKRAKAIWVALGLAGLVGVRLVDSALWLNAGVFLTHRAWAQDIEYPPERAVQLARQAVQWYGGNSRAYYLLGVAANREEMPVEAVKNLETAVRLDQNDYLAHYQLGWGYYAQDRLAEAVEQWRISQGDNAILHEADARFRQNRLAEAAHLYTTAIIIDPTLREAWYGLEVTYSRWEQSDEAYASGAYTSLGDTVAKGGWPNEARKAYLKALELDPTNEWAQQQLQALP